MNPKSFEQGKPTSHAPIAQQGRRSRRALALLCGALIAAAPGSDAFAFGGFGHFSRGGGMPMSGRSASYSYDGGASHWNRPRSLGSHQPAWHMSERRPSHDNWDNGRSPVRIIHNGTSRQHPIYQGGETVPPPPAFAGSQANDAATNSGQPQAQPTNQATQRARSGAPATGETRFVRDEVLFTVSGASRIAESLGQKHHLVLVSSKAIALIGGGTMNRFRIPDHRPVPDVIRDLETEQQITWAQPNYIFKLEGADTEPHSLAAAQYTLTKMHLPEAHRVTEGDKALVAVIDSGIDESHPEIAGSIVDRFDTIGGDLRAEAHGTAIAGAIGGHGALIGVAPHADILAIRAFTGSASKPGAEGTTAHVIAGLNWAFEHHARVVNMSFAGPFDPLLALTVKTAHQKDMILVAAAGNEGPMAAPAYPAADANVIAVTATDRDDRLLAAANHGSYICLAAPGTDIIAAAPANSYQFSSGTSIAAAHISGLIALLLAEMPDLAADTVRRVLRDTARDIGGAGKADEFGAGLADAARAVAVVDILWSEDAAGKSLQAKVQ